MGERTQSRTRPGSGTEVCLLSEADGPTLPEIHWVLGYVKMQQRRHDEALAHLDDALHLDPRFADALAEGGS